MGYTIAIAAGVATFIAVLALSMVTTLLILWVVWATGFPMLLNVVADETVWTLHQKMYNVYGWSAIAIWLYILWSKIPN